MMRWTKPEASVTSGDLFVSSLCQKMTARALAGDRGVSCIDNEGEFVYDATSILCQSSSLPTKLFDRLRLLSPRTWWGVMVGLDSNSLSPFDISTVVQNVVALLLPVLILWAIDLTRLTFLRHRGLSIPKRILGRLVFASLVSPWSLRCIYELVEQLSTLLLYLRTTLKNRSPTLTRAINVLSERIRNHRAYRTRRFDVYLPPSLITKCKADRSKRDTDFDKNNENSSKLQALLFLPGALVSHEAYSEVAARLSDNGFLVAVASMEPLRLAQYHLGADKASVTQIIERISQHIRMHTATTGCRRDAESDEPSKTAVAEFPVCNTMEWTLMGHSMGSFAAMKLLDEFFDAGERKNGNSNGTRTIVSKLRRCPGKKDTDQNGSSEIFGIDVVLSNKLVMWGVAAFPGAATDLSDHTESEVLIVQGSKDVFVNLMRYRQNELEACFPPRLKTVEISGGTHEGFSSYKASYPFGDDEDSSSGGGTKRSRRRKTLPLEEQHKRACDATTQFLRR